MFIDAYLRIQTAAAKTAVLKGESEDAKHTDEIEILSFEHTVKRTPRDKNVEDQQAEAQSDLMSEQLRRLRAKATGKKVKGPRRPGLVSSAYSKLVHTAFHVVKAVDAASPKLYSYACKQDFLEKVVVTVRAPSQTGPKTVYGDYYVITMSDAYISQLTTIADPKVQGFGTSLHLPIFGRELIDVGPVDVIEFTYGEIMWKCGTTETSQFLVA